MQVLFETSANAALFFAATKQNSKLNFLSSFFHLNRDLEYA